MCLKVKTSLFFIIVKGARSISLLLNFVFGSQPINETNFKDIQALFR